MELHYWDMDCLCNLVCVQRRNPCLGLILLMLLRVLTLVERKITAYMMAETVDSIASRYSAAMVLAGTGDALGYKHGEWEFNYNGEQIHEAVKKLGGLSKLKAKLPAFCVSDDTVMHLATGRALVTHKDPPNMESLYDNFAHEYIKCMNDMKGRGPGGTCMGSCHQLAVMRERNPGAKLYRIPFNKRGGGCGAAMRAMCIGLRYPYEVDEDKLIAVSIESGRMTHNNPTGHLGSLVSALFTAYALQSKPVNSWGAMLMQSALPKAKAYIETIGIDVEDNLSTWDYFENAWSSYLASRNLTDGQSEPVFAVPYDVKERDEFYTKISYQGWGGASGHDSVIIAYDALLGCEGKWEELANRAIFHGGDNDSTGTIASCWFGALYGIEGVYKNNYKKLEYRDQMEDLAKKLYDLSHPQSS